MHKHILASGITILFLLTVFSPLTMGWNGEEVCYENDSIDFIDYVHTSPEDIRVSDVSSKLKYVFASPETITNNHDEPQQTTPSYKLKHTLSRYLQPLSPQMLGGPINSSWPMFCYNNHHTGLSPYNTAQNPGVEKWRFKTEGSVNGGIAIDTDGTLYFGDFGGRLYALSPNGTLK